MLESERKKKAMSHVKLNVPDISCAHCERTILTALKDQPGVQNVKVDIPSKTVDLSYDENKINLNTVNEILDEEGYTVESAVTV